LTVLLETFEKFSQSTVQKTARASPAYRARQVTEKAAQAGLPLFAWPVGRSPVPLSISANLSRF
jgi:hypothetical protein